MQKRNHFHFQYPPNIHELDLATMVSMFRSRGEPRKAPPGEYYFNRYPGQENRALLCGESLSLLTEDRMNKLDLALENGPEDSGMFSTSLRFERIDGPSSGQVKFSHLLAIMATASTGAMFRLEIRGETGSSSDSATTR